MRWSTLILFILYLGGARAAEIPVDLILVLATDVSASITDDEYRVERDGIRTALLDPAVADAIARCARGGIALAYTEWAGFDSYRRVVPLRRVADGGGLRAFADEMNKFGRSTMSSPGTDIAFALEQSRVMINQSRFQAGRRVIDVSSDGFQNDGPTEESPNLEDYITRLNETRDQVVADIIGINALALERNNLPAGYPDLKAYYTANVIGGPGAFVVSIDSAREMHERLRDKLAREICAGANF